jgi:hypothetical protein
MVWFKIFTRGSTLVFVLPTKVSVFIRDSSGLWFPLTKPPALTETIGKWMVASLEINTLLTWSIREKFRI